MIPVGTSNPRKDEDVSTCTKQCKNWELREKKCIAIDLSSPLLKIYPKA
jgi:hypothetical protein